MVNSYNAPEVSHISARGPNIVLDSFLKLKKRKEKITLCFIRMFTCPFIVKIK